MLHKSDVPLKIYLSGAITNNPTAQDDFFAAELEVKSLFPNAVVFNPIRLGKLITNWDLHYSEIMHLDMTFLNRADAVYMLRNWKISNGANEELARAKALKKSIMFQENRQSDGSYSFD